MPVCTFCKKGFEMPRGLTYVLVNGEIVYYCSSKCFKNSKIRKKSEKLSWVRKKDKNEKIIDFKK